MASALRRPLARLFHRTVPASAVRGFGAALVVVGVALPWVVAASGRWAAEAAVREAMVLGPPLVHRVIERPVAVRAELRGAVHPDYEHTRTMIDPPRWRIRGGSGPVSEVQSLSTEPIVLDDITADTVVEVALQRPSQSVEFTATSPGEEPQVKVTLAVRPRLGERRLSAAVAWPPDQVAPLELPTEVSAIVRGGLPDLRIVDAALSPPLVAMPRREKPSADFPGGSVVFVVQFTPAVPPEVQARLSVEAALDRVALAAPAEATPPAR